MAGRRRYGRDHLYRIAVILRAKEAGFGLDDIRDMLTAPSPSQRTEILRRHRTELARRIAQAQASLDLIDCALTCDHEDFTSCPHFQAMVADRIGVETPVHVPAGTPPVRPHGQRTPAGLDGSEPYHRAWQLSGRLA